MMNTAIKGKNDLRTDDGVMGVITNNTGERLVVKTVFQPGGKKPDGNPIELCCSVAVLENGDSMTYMLNIGKPGAVGSTGGQLEFYKYDNGQAVGDAVKFSIQDQYVGYPFTQMTPGSKRTGWKQFDSHEEKWGTTTLVVTRQKDPEWTQWRDTSDTKGWPLPPSSAGFKKYYQNIFNVKYGSVGVWDWPVFAIKVNSL